jgi:hypothetical protein
MFIPPVHQILNGVVCCHCTFIGLNSVFVDFFSVCLFNFCLTHCWWWCLFVCLVWCGGVSKAGAIRTLLKSSLPVVLLRVFKKRIADVLKVQNTSFTSVFVCLVPNLCKLDALVNAENARTNIPCAPNWSGERCFLSMCCSSSDYNMQQDLNNVFVLFWLTNYKCTCILESFPQGNWVTWLWAWDAWVTPGLFLSNQSQHCSKGISH